MMQVIPAMDLMDGRCVRLSQGDFGQRTVYPGDPVEVAARFADAGVRRLHVVDLDGARSATPRHLHVLEAIARDARIGVDFSGGLRTMGDVEAALQAGARYVALGSLAAKEPGTVIGWARYFGPERFIIGADVRDGIIATHGWKETSGLHVEDFLEAFVREGITRVLCTDIARDGMLKGPATELYAGLAARFPSLGLIASGGVRSTEDLQALEESGCAAAIVGKALYEGHVTLEELRPWL